MAKSSPEKLAQALRANLKRRKEAPSAKGAKAATEPPAQRPVQPPKNSA